MGNSLRLKIILLAYNFLADGVTGVTLVSATFFLGILSSESSYINNKLKTGKIHNNLRKRQIYQHFEIRKLTFEQRP